MSAGTASRGRTLDLVAVVRGIGWMFVVISAVVLLYVVYLLWFTGLATAQAQAELADHWSPKPSDAVVAETNRDDVRADPDRAPAIGEPVAVLRFERGGDAIVSDDELYVVEGVADAQLRDGPGRYPSTGMPGLSGNVAIAGHRTTYGAPFWSLDSLRHGDTIHLIDEVGDEWIYGYVKQQIVAPSDTWVLGGDPLGTGVPTLTLTTCHPRHSAAQRLVVFAELLDHRPAST
ncbi:sortase [Nitriliruptor alkaliphilus]|uniref:sortase n=1 Tax=Nitriliruptor alkaliphilus TaxID=427918 RepID=UPI0006975267|nr:sortase [Nitriliruptor alkaliphilus]